MQTFKLENPTTTAANFMLQIVADVTNISPAVHFPAIRVTAECAVWQTKDGGFAGEVADWGFSIPGRVDLNHPDIAKALAVVATIDEIAEFNTALEAQLLQLAISKVEDMRSTKEESKPAVDVQDILDKINIERIVRDAVEDANIAENVDIEINSGYGRDFSIDVEFNDDSLIYTIIQGIEEAISEEVEESSESAN